jgi:hypothetical protein
VADRDPDDIEEESAMAAAETFKEYQPLNREHESFPLLIGFLQRL